MQKYPLVNWERDGLGPRRTVPMWVLWLASLCLLLLAYWGDR